MTRVVEGDLYHCGDPESGPDGGFQCVYTLCGLDIQDESIESLAWDLPQHFMVDWWTAPQTMPPRCSECMAHPDFSFLVLGEL